MEGHHARYVVGPGGGVLEALARPADGGAWRHVLSDVAKERQKYQPGLGWVRAGAPWGRSAGRSAPLRGLTIIS